MSTPETDPAATPSQAGTQSLGIVAIVRCLLALFCSHVAAPYAAGRLTIRYQLQGDFEMRYAVIAGVAMTIGALLAFRQLVNLPSGSKRLYAITGIVMWYAVSFVLLVVAAESTIPSVLLALLWAGGSLWIVWTVWAYSLFRSTGVLIGTVLVGVVAIPFWTLVEATGILGSTRVEFAWRRSAPRAVIDHQSNRQSTASAVRWPGFLGANRDGAVTETALDEDWSSRPPEQLWQQECGLGWSSFAVTETTLYGQEQLASGDSITARDLNTGELLWAATEEHDGFTSGLGGDGPRATPTLHPLETDGSTRLILLAVGPTGQVSCLDASTGEIIWKTDLMEEFPGESLIHGVCGSPLVVDDLVVVAPPTDAGPGLVAFHLQDGSLAWRCSSSWRASYSSPALMTICDRPQIVLHAGPGVMGVDPANGTALWQFEWSNEHSTNATQPLQVLGEPNDLLVATGYQGGMARISVSEDAEGQLQASEVWSNRKLMRTKFCGIAQFGDIVVGLDNAILCALDVNTGKRRWKKGRYGFGQLLKVGEYLLVVEERGGLQLLKPDAKSHHQLNDGVNPLDRKTWSHPVLVDDRLYVRNDQQIVCMRLPILSADAATEGAAPPSSTPNEP